MKNSKKKNQRKKTKSKEKTKNKRNNSNMGICYINKSPNKVVVNSKLTAEQSKIDNFPKSKLLLIKSGQLIIFKYRIRQIYTTNSLRQINLSDYMKIVRESKNEKSC